MMPPKTMLMRSVLAVLPMLAFLQTAPARAYVDLAPTLPRIISDSQSIAVVEVVSYNRETHELTLKEIRAAKGELATAEIRHVVAPADGAAPPRPILQWATPGSRGVMFGSRATALVCMGTGWYQVRVGGGAWKLGADRPDLPLAYYGSVNRLTEAVDRIQKGDDAIITVVAFGADNEGASFDLALNRQNLPGTVRVQRIRASSQMPSTVASASNNPAYYIGPGEVDPESVPALIEQLHAGDAGARAQAAEDLRSLGKMARPAVVALQVLLNDTDEKVRVAAASALLRINPKENKPLEILEHALASADGGIQRAAAQATGFAGAAAGPLSEKLAQLLASKDEATRITALQAITLLGPAAAPAAKAVMPMLDDAEYQIDAADALGRIGEASRPALPRLAKMLSSDQANVRWAAVRSMAQIGGPDAHPAVDFMIKAFPSATEVEGYNMMIYLSLLGPVAKDALPTIRNTRIKNPVLPSATQWAIAPDQGFPWLGGNGGGPGGFGRGGGGPGGGGPGGGGDIFTLVFDAYAQELGPRLNSAAKVLAQKIMEGSAGNVPEYGYKILASGAHESVNVLAPHLTDGDPAMRERATVALGNMGPAAAPAKGQVEAAISKASTERERKLLEWCLREINDD